MVIKAGLVATFATATVVGLSSLFALAGVTVAAPVVAVVVGALFVGVILGYLFDKGEKTLGRALGEADATTCFAKKFRETAQYLSDITKDVRYERYALAPILPIGN